MIIKENEEETQNIDNNFDVAQWHNNNKRDNKGMKANV